MQKIPTLYKRIGRELTCECNPECLWVFHGEGMPTQKWDGTACMVQNGELYRRYDANADFMPAQKNPDGNTGHWPGWVPCRRGNPSDKYHFRAFEILPKAKNGTYELCGPKVQGNPENLERHKLIPHGHVTLIGAPTSFDALKVYLASMDIEGIVWHHQDGRMAKIKKKDFGLLRMAWRESDETTRPQLERRSS